MGGKPMDRARLTVTIVMGAIIIQVPILFALFRLVRVEECSIALNRASQIVVVPGNNYTVQSVEAVQTETSRTLNPGNSSSSSQTAAAHPESTPNKIKALKPLSYAQYSFILFSTYRASLETLYVLGLTSVMVRDFEHDQPVYVCEWHEMLSNGTLQEDGFLTTEPEMIYVRFEENDMVYVPVVVNCTFNQSVGAEGRGGALRLRVARGPNYFDERYVVEEVFEEAPGDVEKIRLPVSPAHKYAFCGPPVHGKMNAEWVEPWLAYHHRLFNGQAHFYLYNVGGIEDDVSRTVLEPYERAGLLTVFQVPQAEDFPGWYHQQVLFIEDCIHRTRFTAEWSFSFDLDEYLYVLPPKTIDSLLEENRELPWITFGSIPYSTGHCRLRSSPDEWDVERLLWRQKVPECNEPEWDPWQCVRSNGRRKYVVNPRKVFAVGVHKISPEVDGLDLNATIARIHHFQGALNPRRVCGIPVNTSMTPDDMEWWNPGIGQYECDETIVLESRKAKEFARSQGLLSLTP